MIIPIILFIIFYIASCVVWYYIGKMKEGGKQLDAHLETLEMWQAYIREVKSNQKPHDTSRQG